ncbi:MAG: hypothetical protein V3W34_11880 [Phycisphaerae bacterium]
MGRWHSANEPSEACLEPPTVRWQAEITCRAEQGDLDYLCTVGRVFQAVAS